MHFDILVEYLNRLLTSRTVCTLQSLTQMIFQGYLNELDPPKPTDYRGKMVNKILSQGYDTETPQSQTYDSQGAATIIKRNEARFQRGTNTDPTVYTR